MCSCKRWLPFHRAAQVGEEWEGDGRYGMRSRRGRPAEIREGTDYIEVAVFTGDFIEGHSGYCAEIKIDKTRAYCWHAPYILSQHVIQAIVC